MRPQPPPAGAAEIGDLAERAGIGQVRLIAWRDRDDPAAGGSEIHANKLAAIWADNGLNVRLRTAAVAGAPPIARRDGIDLVRRGGKVSVLVRAPAAEVLRRHHAGDALVEVWHGINFMAPLWARGPRIGIAHHVHGDQFPIVLPAPIAPVAQGLERHVYPRLYRRTPLVTLSESVRAELIALGYSPGLVTAIPPGVDESFRPGAASPLRDLVIVVARLMPQKRVDVVLDAVARLRTDRPELRLVIVGDGPERPRLEQQNAACGSPATFAGRVSHTELIELYRQAWIVATASSFEGWGMTLTEAAACGTPAIAFDISGHREAVVDGETGLLVATNEDFTLAMARVLDDEALRRRLGDAAALHASRFRWEAAAAATFEVLAGDAINRRS